MKLMLQCLTVASNDAGAFDLDSIYDALARLVRGIAWDAAHPCSAAEREDDAAFANTSGAANKVMMIPLALAGV